jgi:hypothetical protein
MTILAALDIVVAALLVATIVYCVMLNRRLGALRRNEAELRAVLASFGDAAAKAEAGLSDLKKAGGEIGGMLRRQVSEARAVYDDLAFVTERADRLVSAVGGATAAAGASGAKAAPQPRREIEPAARAPTRDLSRAERELLEALASVR